MVWIPFWAAGVINGMGHYWATATFRSRTPAPTFPRRLPDRRRRVSTTTITRIRRRRNFRVPGMSSTSVGCTSSSLKRWFGSRRQNRAGAPVQPRQDGVRRGHRASRHYSSLYVLAQYTRSVRNACRQEIHRLTQLAAMRSGEGIDASLREQAAALAASSHLGSKSTANRDSRIPCCTRITVPDRLFDAQEN